MFIYEPPSYDIMRKALPLFFLQIPNSSVGMRKHQPRTQMEGQSTKPMTDTTEKCQGQERQGNPERLSEAGED